MTSLEKKTRTEERFHTRARRLQFERFGTFFFSVGKMHLCLLRRAPVLLHRRAAQYVTPLVEVILGEGSGHKLPPGCVLNVNVPPARVPVKGYFITHQVRGRRAKEKQRTYASR